MGFCVPMGPFHPSFWLWGPQDSAWPWLDAVLPRLGELLVLEDVAALQMEVGALARDFPDVR